MAKRLMVDKEKCTGCRTCELACSFRKHETFNPIWGRVQVREWDGLPLPQVCLQCDEPACEAACPVQAITRADTGALVVDQDLCIRCQQCVDACPYGGVTYTESLEAITKCDLCGGDPACAGLCPAGALVYREKTAADAAGVAALEVIFNKLAKGEA